MNAESERARVIPLDKIDIQRDNGGDKLNPRGQHIGDTTDLQHSIQAVGLVQPLVVRPYQTESGETRYWLVHGERRLTALRQMGEQEYEVWVVTHEANDLLLMLAANVVEPYPPLELGRTFVRLREQGFSNLDIAAICTGQRPDIVSAHIRLLEACPEVQEMVTDGRMGMSVFARIKTLSESDQREIIKDVPEGKVRMQYVLEKLRERKAKVQEALQAQAEQEEPAETDIDPQVEADIRAVRLGLMRIAHHIDNGGPLSPEGEVMWEQIKEMAAQLDSLGE